MSKPFPDTDHTLEDGHGVSITFRGVLLSFISSHESKGKRSKYWSEQSLWRTSDGGYIVRTVGASAVEGQVPLINITCCRKPNEVAEAVQYIRSETGERYYTQLAISLLKEASERDEALKVCVRDIIDQQRSPHQWLERNCPADGTQHILKRDGAKALLFYGALLSHKTSYHAGARSWYEAAIYATSQNRYITHRMAASTEGVRHSTVTVTSSIEEILSAFTQDRPPWIEPTTRRVLQGLIRARPEFRKSVETHLRALDAKPITVENLGIRVASKRYEWLSYFASGSILRTKYDYPMQIDSWLAPHEDKPLPPRQVVHLLASQKLIMATRSEPAQEAEREQHWSITDLGRRAVANATEQERRNAKE